MIMTVDVMMFEDGVNRLSPMLIGVAEAVHRHNRCQPAQKQKAGYQPQPSESPGRRQQHSISLTLSNVYTGCKVLVGSSSFTMWPRLECGHKMKRCTMRTRRSSPHAHR